MTVTDYGPNDIYLCLYRDTDLHCLHGMNTGRTDRLTGAEWAKLQVFHARNERRILARGSSGIILSGMV